MSSIMRKVNDIVNQLKSRRSDEVLDLVHAVMHRYRSQQYQALRAGPHDITHMESKVLDYFGRHPGATQNELSGHSGRDKAQLARLIKALRDRALLAGKAGETDRRSVHLTLTAEGESVLFALAQQSQRLNAKAVAGLTKAEQLQFAKLLQRVKANLGAAE
jgi:DNA-binding MarR family transcriptional regulator